MKLSSDAQEVVVKFLSLSEEEKELAFKFIEAKYKGYKAIEVYPKRLEGMEDGHIKIFFNPKDVEDYLKGLQDEVGNPYRVSLSNIYKCLQGERKSHCEHIIRYR